MTSLLIQAGAVVALLMLGFFFGTIAEKRHYKRIREREAMSVGLPVIASRYPPEDQRYAQHLVSGNVVIASDYFKTFLAGLVNIFGGRVTPFESMLDRARREAVLRMKEQASQLNAAYVFNIKLDTSRVANGRLAAMEILAYGTAMIPIERSDNALLPDAARIVGELTELPVGRTNAV